MRVDIPSLSQSLVETPKLAENMDVTRSDPGEPEEEPSSFVPAPLASSRTYSLNSLRAAVDYHAKFLTVAESNLKAIQHAGAIPQVLLDHLNGR